jgi:Beta-propeller repeat/Cep192 domain 4
MRRVLAGLGVVFFVVVALALGLSSRTSAGNRAKPSWKAASPPTWLGSSRATEGMVPASAKTSASIVQKYEQLPLAFEPNEGQARNGQFLARGSGYMAILSPTEAAVALRTAPQRTAAGGARQRAAGFDRAGLPGRVLRIELAGANRESRLSPFEKLPGKSNYLIGKNPAKWRTNVPNYAKVREQAVYPGIDLVYHGTERQLEYDFVVAAGVNPRLIRLGIQGADKLHINEAGDLIASVSGGAMRFARPVAYQEKDGAKQAVRAGYALTSARTVAFRLGPYDPNRPLVIDPILAYSTFLGGSNIDVANAIALAPDGTAFVTGGTFSGDFPTSHPLQPNTGGPRDFPQDAFVTKLSADGSTLLYSTYLGGSSEDIANGIAVDSFGDAYVTGTTFSTDFPVTPLPINGLCGGDGKCGATFNPQGFIVSNGFLTKLNPAGSALIYSTYIGEYENVRCQAVAVDSNQIVYLTGATDANHPVTVVLPPAEPPPPPFPITGTAFQPGFAGVTDAFVMKISSTGSSIQYSSYLGGDDEDIGFGIAVDSNANAYVTGLTYSGFGFPLVNALQATFGGAGDAFFSKVNTNGSGAGSLLYSTYLGGTGIDQGNGVAVDSTGIAYVAGVTASATLPFTTIGALNGPADAFAAKLDATQTGAASLLYFRYFGGSGADAGAGIAVDSSGNAYVTGSTTSVDFPTTAAVFQPAYGGGNTDAFVTKIDPTGNTLLYSTFLGGSNADSGNGIAVDANGDAFVTGQTCSQDFPLAHPEQPAPGGNCDAFVSEVSILSGIALNPAGLVFPPQSLGTTSQPETVTLTNGDNAQTITSIVLGGADPQDFTETNTCPASLTPGATCTITVTFTPTVAGIRTASVTITDSAPGSPQVVNLTGSTSTLTLSTSNLAFGNQQVGTTSNALPVVATDDGTTAITFTSITASGDFAETDDCLKAPLQPTTNCTILVTFTPSAVGSSIGALTLNDSAPGSPQIVLLTGTGTSQATAQGDFTIAALPPSATITAGQSAQYTVSVTATGGFSTPVSLSCTGLPTASGCSVSPNPVTPGTSSTVTITTQARAMAPPGGDVRIEPPGALRIPGWFWITLLGLMLLLIATRRQLRTRPVPAALALAATLALLSACGGGGKTTVTSGTPAGTYQVTIVGTGGGLTHTATVTLQVK